MAVNRNQNRKQNRKLKKYLKFSVIILSGSVLMLVLLGIAGAALGLFSGEEMKKTESPEALLLAYMAHIPEKEYLAMYQMTDPQGAGVLSPEDFVERNSKIYEGIELQNLRIDQLKTEETKEGRAVVSYRTTFDTVAGEVCFENEAEFVKGEDGYQLLWDDHLIFPNLKEKDKVRVVTEEAERGSILDRNGSVLAGKGTASSVGIVPGKLADKEAAVLRLSELLELAPEAIEKALGAGWVKEDSFVPLKTLPKRKETDFMAETAEEAELEEWERQEQLLEIPGVMISDTEVREYPLKEAAAHLIGYVQHVTAEDLEEHEGEGYTANSVIGRSGMEGLYETELKGQNGCGIYIVGEDGKQKETVARIPRQDGADIRLTIDGTLQKILYQQFREDKSCSVALQPNTGEVLALISTPSYDNNRFIFGLSEETWNAWNEDERQPMYNRFRQVWCPGSAFKPIIGAIGLETGAIDPLKDYGNEGLSWQKDASWGGYFVTTLHGYEEAVLENALIYSDNIYFAKAALEIGANDLTAGLDRLGFQEEVPFEIVMKKSQYSNDGKIESEIQLADSGYGQGQVLINPLHLACLYTAFFEEGNVRKPSLRMEESRVPEDWIPSAFSKETAAVILEGMKQVVSHPDGTGYQANRTDILFAGKTGTAEIKLSKEDTTGTELGWFVVGTPEPGQQPPLLLVSMVEDVKERGGSGYVVEKVSAVLDQYLTVGRE